MIALGILSLLFILCGLISIIIPLRFIYITSRPRGALVALLGMFGFVLFATNSEPNQTTSSSKNIESSTNTSRQSTQAQPTIAQRAVSLAPATEKNFVSAVDDARRAYQQGANEMAQGAARPARARVICSLISSLGVQDWIGQVYDLSTNNEGKGVLALKLPNTEVYVQTWNNAFSDIIHGSLIDPNSDVYRKAITLKEGQWVTFSGSFFREDADCIHEQSTTLSGSMRSPEFTFKFSDLKAIN